MNYKKYCLSPHCKWGKVCSVPMSRSGQEQMIVKAVKIKK